MAVPRCLKLEELPDPEAGSRSGGRSPAGGRRESRRRYIRTGAYARKPALPFIPGSDAAGEIETGRRERESCRRSAIACSSTARPPNTPSATTAGLTPSAPSAVSITSTRCRRRFPSDRARRWACRTRPPIVRCFIARRRRPGETVLVHGATGGVGSRPCRSRTRTASRVLGTGGTGQGLAGRARERRRRCRSTTRRRAISTTS